MTSTLPRNVTEPATLASVLQLNDLKNDLVCHDHRRGCQGLTEAVVVSKLDMSSANVFVYGIDRNHLAEPLHGLPEQCIGRCLG